MHYNRLRRTGSTERTREVNTGRTCKATGCENPAEVKGMCRTCEVRARRYGGDPDARGVKATKIDSLETCLWRRTTVVGDCWVFTGAATGKDGTEGYRGIRWQGRWRSAHRTAYLFLVDPDIKGLDVHHNCETKGCWRPEHLEALTRLEHRQRHPR